MGSAGRQRWPGPLAGPRASWDGRPAEPARGRRAIAKRRGITREDVGCSARVAATRSGPGRRPLDREISPHPGAGADEQNQPTGERRLGLSRPGPARETTYGARRAESVLRAAHPHCGQCRVADFDGGSRVVDDGAVARAHGLTRPGTSLRHLPARALLSHLGRPGAVHREGAGEGRHEDATSTSSRSTRRSRPWLSWAQHGPDMTADVNGGRSGASGGHPAAG